jgi:uncharacterized protein YndB with AHSA1/START domain
MTMTKPDYIYTTYIKTTPEKLWTAITTPEFTRQYWGKENVSDWKKGSKWEMVGTDADCTVSVIGEVVESVPGKRLVLSWAEPTDKNDVSHVTFEIEPMGDTLCLNVIHSGLKAGSVLEGKIAFGWPRVLSSLKSLLETGKALEIGTGCKQEKAA